MRHDQTLTQDDVTHYIARAHQMRADYAAGLVRAAGGHIVGLARRIAHMPTVAKPA